MVCKPKRTYTSIAFNSMKTKILVLSEWYLPGFKAGGPIQSLTNFVNAFSQTYDISVFTRNTDAFDAIPYPNIEPNTWITNHQGIKVFYGSADFLAKKKNVLSVIDAGNYDYLYVNSMYSVPFSITPLLFYPKKKSTLIIAARGSLLPTALRIKPLKKIVFLNALKLLDFHAKAIWQATDSYEEEAIRKALGKKVQIRVAPNLPRQDQPPFSVLPKVEGEVKLVYISRIHHIKNLHFLLDKISKAKGKINLDVYGPMEETAYWETCQAIIQTLHPDKQVQYKGPLPQSKISETIQQYHVFCLPTFGENFGHAIFDALISGRPILISGDTTPWRELTAKHIGWDLPLKYENGWVDTLEKICLFSDEEYQTWAKAAYEYANKYLNNPDLRKKVENLFSAR